MPATLPIEVYEAFEEGLGKEKAKVVVKFLETTITEVTANTWEKTKNELLDRLVSKEEFKKLKEEFKELRIEFKEFREEIRAIDGKINETNQTINESNSAIYQTINESSRATNQTINESNRAIYQTINESSRATNQRIDETNKRIDSVMKIQLWIMGLIAVQAVAVIVKIIFPS